ncbi:MAG: DUF1127 domain-containing protein [Alphaproteobacteria bacterium]|jgi:hypothetical protein|nr:DUF1127 domain-containing protein [Alphaproteobacteria bacterium]
MMYIQGLSQDLVSRQLRDLDGDRIETPATRGLGAALQRRLSKVAAHRSLAAHSDRLLADMGYCRDQLGA